MRGFQKYIALGGRTSRSALKVLGGGWWVGGLLDYSVYLSPLYREEDRTRGDRLRQFFHFMLMETHAGYTHKITPKDSRDKVLEDE